jgi:hypothetical protein
VDNLGTGGSSRSTDCYTLPSLIQGSHISMMALKMRRDTLGDNSVLADETDPYFISIIEQ